MTADPPTPATITGIAAGVPFVAHAPAHPGTDSPVVVVWHMLDAPRTERAMAAALPLDGLDAWRVYCGLPHTGERLPEGGWEELGRRGATDAVRALQGPIAIDGATEFPAMWAELHGLLGVRRDARIGLVGGSIGGMVAGLAAIESVREAGVTVTAVVLVSPVVRLAAFIDSMAERFGFAYPWDGGSTTIADRLDLITRAGEFADAGSPAVRIVVGADDDAVGILAPARALTDTLATRYDDSSRIDLVEVAGMAHAIADEPGMDTAPQTPAARAVDAAAADWLRTHLG